MKILAVSDIHYEKEGAEDPEDTEAWNWLLSIVDYHKPDLIVGCGDWGSAINTQEFKELLSKTKVYTIYGNHENLKVLSELKNRDGTPVLLQDCEVVEFNGIKIGGINGIIALRRKSKKGVPRKRPEEFVEAAYCLAEKKVDLLLIHETVPLPEYRGLIRFPSYLSAVVEAIKIAAPRLVVNGHIHIDQGYTLSRINNIMYLRVDSSQKSQHYAVLEENYIEVWRDLTPLEKTSFPLVLH